FAPDLPGGPPPEEAGMRPRQAVPLPQHPPTFPVWPPGRSTAGLALTLLLALTPAVGAADRPGEVSASIFAAAKTAVADGNVEKTAEAGLTLQKASFSEMSRDGGILVGFDVSVGPFQKETEVGYGRRPIYMAAVGEASYHEYGSLVQARPRAGAANASPNKPLHTVRVTADPGYAVGLVTVRTGLGIKGLSVTFLPIKS